MTRKFLQHIQNEAYVDFVKETKAILDAEHEKQIREYVELLIRGGDLVKPQESEELSEAQMTRKHFQMAADAVKSIEDKQKRKEMALHHAEIFSKSNPRFDRARFLKAADVEDDAEKKNLKEALVSEDAVKHQLKIAHSTLKMSDAGASIMGGMSKPEAAKLIVKHKGKEHAKKLLSQSGHSEEEIKKLLEAWGEEGKIAERKFATSKSGTLHVQPSGAVSHISKNGKSKKDIGTLSVSHPTGMWQAGIGGTRHDTFHGALGELAAAHGIEYFHDDDED